MKTNSSSTPVTHSLALLNVSESIYELCQNNVSGEGPALPSMVRGAGEHKNLASVGTVSVRTSSVVLTWVKIFLNKLHLEMEDLLLQFTNGVFHFLPSRHHVTEISNLQKHNEQCLV